MRTKLGLLASLLAVTVLALTSFGAAASADDEPAVDEVPVGDVTADEGAPDEATSTSTSTTTTTVPTAEPIAGAARAEGGATRGDRIEAPGQATAPAQRNGQAAQLTEPPPAPTTTTEPPRDALPPDSGHGRRIVYSKANQWVWLVEEDEQVAHHFAVSGRRTWNQPLPGTYRITSRSERTWSRASDGAVTMRFMMRFTTGPGGDNIGFHEIPTRSGVPLQSEGQLGEPLSAGCVRLGTGDILFLWHWAPNGTTVVVLP